MSASHMKRLDIQARHGRRKVFTHSLPAIVGRQPAITVQIIRDRRYAVLADIEHVQ